MYNNLLETSSLSTATDASARLNQISSGYYTAATTVLILWNYVLSFDEEVAFFWTRKYSGASALFLALANRYLSLGRAFYALSPGSTSSLDSRQCTAKAFTLLFLEISQYAVWAIFSSLRAYALRRQWIWAALVFLLSIVPIVASAALILVSQGSSVSADTGCAITLHGTTLRSEWIAVICARAGLIVGDVIVVAITWVCADVTPAQDVLKAIGRAKTLSSVMYQNGALYFVASTSLNALVLVLYVITCTSRRSAGLSLFANFVETIYAALVAILTTNFLVKLQEAANASTRLSSHWRSQSGHEPLSVLRFARADVDNRARDVHSIVAPGDDSEGSERWLSGEAAAVPRYDGSPLVQELAEEGA